MAAGDRNSNFDGSVIKLKQPPMNQAAVDARHDIFVREYVKDFNGVRAVIAAGYSTERAGSTFCDLRSRPEIAARIRKAVEERKQLHEVDITLVLDELYNIAMANLGALPRDSDGNILLDALTPDQERLIASVKTTAGKFGTSVEVKTHDKLAAIIHYLKLNGMGIDLPQAIPNDEVNEDEDAIYFVEPKALKP